MFYFSFLRLCFDSEAPVVVFLTFFFFLKGPSVVWRTRRHIELRGFRDSIFFPPLNLVCGVTSQLAKTRSFFFACAG